MTGRQNRILNLQKVSYTIYKEQYIILEKSNSVRFIKIACRKYKINTQILKIQPVKNISLTSVALSSQNISVSVQTGQLTGQQNRTILKVSEVKYRLRLLPVRGEKRVILTQRTIVLGVYAIDCQSRS